MDCLKTRYRIVKDGYCGYEAQYKKWWMPFYCQIGYVNTSSTIEKARQIIDRHRKPLVEQVV